jgi:hypothetical protein
MNLSKFLLGCVLHLSVYDHATGQTVSEKLKIEQVKSFSSSELWNSTTPVIHNVDEVRISLSLVSHETPIVVGKWRQCASVMIGHGDLGTIPVAFRIWARGQCSVEFKNLDTSTVGGSKNFQLTINGDLPVKVGVSRRRNVTVNGMVLGHIRTIYDQ